MSDPLAQLWAEGLVEPVGVDDDGELLWSLTEQGELEAQAIVRAWLCRAALRAIDGEEEE